MTDAMQVLRLARRPGSAGSSSGPCGVRVVVAGLSGTRCCDSPGGGIHAVSPGGQVLTLARRRAASRGTKLRLAVCSALVRRVFEVVGLGAP
jgi:hypothetical protein